MNIFNKIIIKENQNKTLIEIIVEAIEENRVVLSDFSNFNSEVNKTINVEVYKQALRDILSENRPIATIGFIANCMAFLGLVYSLTKLPVSRITSHIESKYKIDLQQVMEEEDYSLKDISKEYLQGFVEAFLNTEEVLSEAPLPDEWDKSYYGRDAKFSKMIKYALERAKRLGQGSSRVAFEIEYQGRPTVLKVAKNAKGRAQNEAELSKYKDYAFSTQILIPMIDADEEYYNWIHFEKAEKMSLPFFRKWFKGFTPSEIVNAISSYIEPRKYHFFDYSAVYEAFDEDYEDNEEFIALQEIAGNYSPTLIRDLAQISNWGVYNGKPVVIDIGYDDDTAKLYQ